MYKIDFLCLNKKSLFAVFALFYIAVFTIGGCNDGRGGGGDDAPGPATSACTLLSEPCSTITEFQNESSPYFECILSDTTCAVDLDNVIDQLQGQNLNVSNLSRLWVGAWGGDGGAADENGGKASPGGYAQTTTTVSDIKDSLGGQSLLYYFLGEAGTTGGNHCGGAGGAATLVTFEDLTLTPTIAPAQDEIFMLAGGGGGASGGTIKGCTNTEGVEGGQGGVTIAHESGTQGLFFNAGAGCNGSSTGCGSGTCGDCVGNLEDSDVLVGEGGGGSQSATGGQHTCCLSNLTPPNNGTDGIGGIGGPGGNGKDCTGPGNTAFSNASLSFSPGTGGKGGGGGNDCTNGGGGGGGGFGGGGGGGHGNENTKAQAGGGGGSAAVSSTQDTSSTPTTRPTNPCGSNGCVTINIFED